MATERLHSDYGSSSSLTNTDSLPSRADTQRSFKQGARRAQRASFQSSASNLSVRSSPESGEEDDFEFDQFCEEMRRQVGERRQSDRRTSTLPYLPPTPAQFGGGEHSPNQAMRPPHGSSADADDATAIGKPSMTGMLEAGSRTQLLPLEPEKEERAEAIIEVEAPPKPSWSSCSGVCVVQ
mmetsp:Transcript_17118/g.35009  ORF Transcript_17118/g.35009 Transcript_17118/m.35009 type:complete len:181 (+) Transcript_17118:2-544(+)